MGEFAGDLTCELISFRHSGFESSSQILPEERESENPQNVAERDEAKTVEIDETSPSQAKTSSSLQDAPMRFESAGARMGDEDRNLTGAKKIVF